MTEIRIRHLLDEVAVPIGEIPFMDVDKVIPHLKRWGISYDYQSDIDTSNLSAEFVVADGAGFFEVLIHDDDD